MRHEAVDVRVGHIKRTCVSRYAGWVGCGSLIFVLIVLTELIVGERKLRDVSRLGQVCDAGFLRCPSHLWYKDDIRISMRKSSLSLRVMHNQSDA